MPETLVGRFERQNVFEHKGVMVEEYVFKQSTDTHILFWCLEPLDYTMIDGKPNPCVKIDFDARLKGKEREAALQVARSEIQKCFENYHKLK